MDEDVKKIRDYWYSMVYSVDNKEWRNMRYLEGTWVWSKLKPGIPLCELFNFFCS